MKKYFGDIVLAIGIILIGGFVFFQQSALNVKGAGGNFNNIPNNLTSTTNPTLSMPSSTTTVSNLVYIGTASTSYSFSTETIDQVNFNLYGLMATTTALTNFTWNGAIVSSSNTALPLNYCYQYSNDQVNYFTPVSSCATLVQESVTATTTKNIAITDVNSKYMRVQFSVPAATSTRFGLWFQATLKKGF